METVAQHIISDMTARGYTFVGQTSGWLSFKPNSNLGRFLAAKGLTADDVVVCQAAKRQRRTEGRQLLVFTKNA